jgi:hypothetical protein
MAKEFERIIGILADLRAGDGGQKLAILVDCPVCNAPLTLEFDKAAKWMHAYCSSDRVHFDWEGDYTTLPGWIDRYSELNT